MQAEAIKQSLEDSGLRCTPQRYAVMAFLMESNRHPTAAEIFEAVNRMDPRSSRATTYNNLRDAKWPSRAAPRDSMRKACGITTSSVIAAATSRTLSGTKCPGLPRLPLENAFFANAN